MGERTIYLDNAATSFPKPEAVHARLGSFLRDHGANPGRGSYRMVQEAESIVSGARRKLAALFNAPDPSRVIFAFNATDALNMGLVGALRKGDHVVTTLVDHNSIVRPLNTMERDGLVTVARVRPDGHGVVDPAEVALAFRPGTRMVAMLHGSNVSGALQPIEAIGKIARERGALFLVDVAQTAGLWPIDMAAAHIDLLATPGHKSLLGPPGTGALILGGGVTLDAWRTGGTGGDSSYPLQPEEYPHHLEAGTLNTPGIAAMMEGVAYVEKRGLDAIRAHEMALLRRLVEGLGDHGKVTFYGPPPSAARVSVVCFNVLGSAPDEVASILDASFDISVRSGLHCAPGAHRELGTYPAGAVRVSPGPFSTADDIDRLVEAVRRIAG